MSTNTATGLPVRELYFIEQGPDEEAIERAKRSLERGEAELGHPDRDLHFVLSPQDDRDDTFGSTFTAVVIVSAGVQAYLIRGSIREDRHLAVRANYHSQRHDGDHYGTIEEVTD